MKYLKQFLIILSVCCIGELIKYFIPLPIPASIYGLVLMLVLLLTKVIRLEQVKDAADFLIEIMPVMFIPACVGLMDSFSLLRGSLLSYVIILAVSTIAVMAVSGLVTQRIIRNEKTKEDQRHV